MKVFYSKRAEQDLVEIGVYTRMEWGDEQWARYERLITTGCEDVLPRMHRLTLSVPKRPALRRWRCERHVIYFRHVDDALEIVRILHERRLAELHL
jgi:plasmid stabilization system protein ParE